jgi:hypothetical protein
LAGFTLFGGFSRTFPIRGQDEEFEKYFLRYWSIIGAAGFDLAWIAV